MSMELDAVREAQSKLCHIAGFAVVVEAGRSAETFVREQPASKIAAAFIGPYGNRRVEGAANGMHWAGRLPEADQVLSTWSQYADESGVCVVEGEFYEEVWNRRPQVGLDGVLARTLLAEARRAGPAAIRHLNGTFSGFLFFPDTQRLWLFLDPTGSRMLYYRTVGGRCEAASSPYGISAGAAPLAVDPLSVNEDLAYGAPLDSRTIFQGVRLVPPGKVVEYQGGLFVNHRYFSFPRRREKMTKGEVGEMICSATERHVRNLGPADAPWCIGLSGGKDSRIVFSALIHEKVDVLPLTFSEGPNDSDARLASEVAMAVGKKTELLDLRQIMSLPEAVAISSDSAILSDGSGIGFGFSLLVACAARHSRLLFTGFTGDCLSGAWGGWNPGVPGPSKS